MRIKEEIIEIKTQTPRVQRTPTCRGTVKERVSYPLTEPQIASLQKKI